MSGPRNTDPPTPSYPVTMHGPVVHGAQRGRTIGFPTANVFLPEKSLPRFGVYAGLLDGMPAAISVGIRPTFGDNLQPMLEAHVIGFEGDLYGRDVTVTLVEHVRDERRFGSVEELVAQIYDDLAAISMILSTSDHVWARRGLSPEA